VGCLHVASAQQQPGVSSRRNISHIDLECRNCSKCGSNDYPESQFGVGLFYLACCPYLGVTSRT
jgi:hypothetical protein